MKKTLALAALAAATLAPAQAPAPQQAVTLEQEKHLRNVRQLTFGGENAEAYWSGDGKSLIYQAAGPGVPCDQIYVMSAAEGVTGPGVEGKRVSTGKGKTTCAYFFPDGKRILYSSTHLASAECPPRPDYSRGYVWPIYAEFDIFVAKPDGSGLKQLTKTPGYDAEATIRKDGKEIVFTSTRDGDLDIYTMDANGKNVRRLTSELGYDGGPFFSPDGKKIVYRAHHPKDPAAAADYKELLAKNLIRPGNLEIWVMDANGANKRQLTSNGAANFAPSWTPDGKRIIFASNMENPKGRNFDLYLINLDGTGLERVTWHSEFDGFPMFSYDGKHLVWASNRGGKQRGDTSIFVAEWVE